ncbi:hypothetical protein ABID21_001004 [Pseudorhizobium tarimense]|uniref:Uncharacterized protein n=1 Tax=Pseudorhizobium tarimense TaxID=1079109 RepID=A0ABV2H2Z0_9HYPH|nr:hypothetical protein [Pseudorhizobium tarimense]
MLLFALRGQERNIHLTELDTFHMVPRPLDTFGIGIGKRMTQVALFVVRMPLHHHDLRDCPSLASPGKE